MEKINQIKPHLLRESRWIWQMGPPEQANNAEQPENKNKSQEADDRPWYEQVWDSTVDNFKLAVDKVVQTGKDVYNYVTDSEDYKKVAKSKNNYEAKVNERTQVKDKADQEVDKNTDIAEIRKAEGDRGGLSDKNTNVIKGGSETRATDEISPEEGYESADYYEGGYVENIADQINSLDDLFVELANDSGAFNQDIQERKSIYAKHIKVLKQVLKKSKSNILKYKKKFNKLNKKNKYFYERKSKIKLAVNIHKNLKNNYKENYEHYVGFKKSYAEGHLKLYKQIRSQLSDPQILNNLSIPQLKKLSRYLKETVKFIKVADGVSFNDLRQIKIIQANIQTAENKKLPADIQLITNLLGNDKIDGQPIMDMSSQKLKDFIGVRYRKNNKQLLLDQLGLQGIRLFEGRIDTEIKKISKNISILDDLHSSKAIKLRRVKQAYKKKKQEITKDLGAMSEKYDKILLNYLSPEKGFNPQDSMLYKIKDKLQNDDDYYQIFRDQKMPQKLMVLENYYKQSEIRNNYYIKSGSVRGLIDDIKSVYRARIDQEKEKQLASDVKKYENIMEEQLLNEIDSITQFYIKFSDLNDLLESINNNSQKDDLMTKLKIKDLLNTIYKKIKGDLMNEIRVGNKKEISQINQFLKLVQPRLGDNKYAQILQSTAEYKLTHPNNKVKLKEAVVNIEKSQEPTKESEGIINSLNDQERFINKAVIQEFKNNSDFKKIKNLRQRYLKLKREGGLKKGLKKSLNKQIAQLVDKNGTAINSYLPEVQKDFANNHASLERRLKIKPSLGLEETKQSLTYLKNIQEVLDFSSFTDQSAEYRLPRRQVRTLIKKYQRHYEYLPEIQQKKAISKRVNKYYQVIASAHKSKVVARDILSKFRNAEKIDQGVALMQELTENLNKSTFEKLAGKTLTEPMYRGRLSEVDNMTRLLLRNFITNFEGVTDTDSKPLISDKLKKILKIKSQLSSVGNLNKEKEYLILLHTQLPRAIDLKMSALKEQLSRYPDEEKGSDGDKSKKKKLVQKLESFTKFSQSLNLLIAKLGHEITISVRKAIEKGQEGGGGSANKSMSWARLGRIMNPSATRQPRPHLKLKD